MKKQVLYGLALMTSIALVSCNDDYTDWSAPQSNPQEEAAAEYSVDISAGPDAVSTMPVQNDELKLVTFASSNPRIVGYSVRSVLLVVGDDTLTVNAEKKDKNVIVSASELNSLLWHHAQTRKSVKYDFKVLTNFGANLDNGDAVALRGETNGSLTTSPTPAEDPKGYFMLGDFGGWDLTQPTWMEKKGNGIYQAIIVTTKDGDNYFKFFQGSHHDNSNWDEVNKGQMGSAVNGDATTPNYIVWEGDETKVETPAIKGAGKWKVTLDVVNMKYSYEAYSTELYLTGSNYNWGGSAENWKKMTLIWGTENVFWTIIYLHANEEFKFAPQAGWGNDFGTEAKLIDTAGAGAGGNGNIKVQNPGWYILKITTGDAKSVEFLQPNVYLMGDAAGEWNINETHKFSVPTTENGEFVSPAFAKDAEVRMCVNLGYDWWKTEFIVDKDGNISFRGNGGDQDRINVKAGQKAYLNFTTGKGSYK